MRAPGLFENQSDLFGWSDPPAWEIPAPSPLQMPAQQQGRPCDEDYNRHIRHYNTVLKFDGARRRVLDWVRKAVQEFLCLQQVKTLNCCLFYTQPVLSSFKYVFHEYLFRFLYSVVGKLSARGYQPHLQVNQICTIFFQRFFFPGSRSQAQL